MLLIGMGIGSAMQTYTIVVQSAVPHRDLGVATGALQFFRNVGSTVGIALLGTMMTANLREQCLATCPPTRSLRWPRWPSPGSPSKASPPCSICRLAGVPAEMIDGIRAGLHAAFQPLSWAGLGFVGITLLFTLFLKPIELQGGRPGQHHTGGPGHGNHLREGPPTPTR